MKPISRSGLRAPAGVVDLERTRGPEGSEERLDVSACATLYCLIRNEGLPERIDFWDVEGDTSIAVADLEAAPPVGRRAVRFDQPSDPVPITVVVCTRERPEGLGRLLRSLEGQIGPRPSVLVVDNAPRSSATLATVKASRLEGLDYVIARRPGLSHARNAGLERVRTDLTAWIDDDEVAEPRWVEQIRAGFDAPGSPAAVCGLMLPAELRSEAQVLFERFNGFNKGRGLQPRLLADPVTSPLYPRPGFGPGGNMAFKTDVLRRAGGFDPCLGAGTRTHGGEETRVLSQILRRGGAVLHQPSAITWHFHRETMSELRAQLRGYSAGLSAFYASTLVHEPGAAAELTRVAARLALGALRGGRAPRIDDEDDGMVGFPIALRRSMAWGLASGAPWYGWESWKHRRQHRPSPLAEAVPTGEEW